VRGAWKAMQTMRLRRCGGHVLARRGRCVSALAVWCRALSVFLLERLGASRSSGIVAAIEKEARLFFKDSRLWINSLLDRRDAIPGAQLS